MTLATESVGQRAADASGVELSSSSSLKAVEESAAGYRNQLRSRGQNAADPAPTAQQGAGSENNTNKQPAPQTSSDNAKAQQDRESSVEARLEKAEQRQEQRQISELAKRDREVRAHEQAHMAAGGQYAGGATYTYERGPNGVRYAVGGEVPIDTGRASTPEETIQKAQIVKRAALAPAEPSPQDRRVAAQASIMEREARQELAEQRRAEVEEQQQARAEARQAAAPGDSPDEVQAPDGISESPESGPGNPEVNARPTPANTISSADGPGLNSPSFLQTRQIGEINSVQALASPRPDNFLDELV